jgi:serine/threonine protein kinase
MIGRTISHYQIIERLGAGGVGEIFKARDSRLNRKVAIKVLSGAAMADPDSRRRFIREARAASGLNHPNIITIHDILSVDDQDYMVMEYVAGKTLADLIGVHGLGVDKTLRYGVQIADALAAAHEAGIVHRDLKPGNVMVTESGRVKVLDFGLAKVSAPVNLTVETQTLGGPITVEGSILGTVSYMSPEQAQGGKVDARSDIFAFGSLMYEMVTGHKAFVGMGILATLTAILRDEPAPIRDSVPGCPPELEEIIGRSLRKSPDDRWQSMQEVHSVLTALWQKNESGILFRPTAPSTIPHAPPPTLPPARRPARNRKWLLLAGSLLVAFGIGGWLMLGRRPQQEPAAPVPAGAIPLAPESAKPSPLAETAKPGTPDPEGALTNQSVIELAAEKVPDTVIVGQIRASKTRFDLSTAGIIQLTRAGVTPAVIEAMRHPSGAPASMPRATQQVPVAGGSSFEIALTEEVSGEPAPGTALHFRAATDVLVDGAVVIAKGAAVTGQVLAPGKKIPLVRRGGKSRFELIDGSKVKVKASPGRNGNKNESNFAPPGTTYLAYFDGDQTVAVKK